MRLLVPALAGASIAGLVAVAAHRAPAGGEPPPPGLEILEPLGVVPHWQLFRWLGERPPGGSFRIRIWNGDWPGSAPVLERETDEPFWRPGEVDRVELPERMVWEVETLDARGRRVATKEGRSQLEVHEAGLDAPLAESVVLTLEPGIRTVPSVETWLEQVKRAEATPSAPERIAARAAFEDYLTAWGRTAEHPGESGFLHHGRRRAALNALVHLEATTDGDAAGREAALEHLYRATARDLSGPPPPEVRRARELLTAGNTLVLAYLPGKSRISVLGLSSEQTFYAALPLRGEYERLRRKLQAGVSDPDTTEETLLENAAALAELLFPPDFAERLVGIEALTIAGSDLLGYVPFELFPLPSGRLLGESLAITYLDSLPRGACLLSREQAHPVRARELGLLLAVPLDGERRERWPELKALPHDSGERRRLRSGLRPGEIESLEARSATRAALSRCARNVRTLHLFVHAVLPAEETTPSLLLSPWGRDRGLLGHTELEGLELPPLVRLSVAGASRETLRDGEPGTGAGHRGAAWDGTDATRFATSALEGGADVVLVAPATLSPESIGKMTPLLHQGLFEDGLEVAEAVRRARLSARAGGSSIRDTLVHVHGGGSAPLR